jgi:hypothetical protein
LGSGLLMAVGHHATTLMVCSICLAAVLLGIMAAVVEIVRIRTEISSEDRRMTALTRLARRHGNPDRAMRLLTWDKWLSQCQAPTNEQAVLLLNDSSSAAEPNLGVPGLRSLVECADAGENVVPDVVPDQRPAIDDQAGNATDLRIDTSPRQQPMSRRIQVVWPC